jgi:uncharacterized protein (TIGR01777 family)
MPPSPTVSDSLATLAGRRVVLAGASGLVGTAVRRSLLARGCVVRQLVRREPRAAGEIRWNPGRGELDIGALEAADFVCNFAGENIAGGRWTAERKAAIVGSRVDATRTLVNAMLATARRPVGFLSASGVGVYGDGGDAVATESSVGGTGFPAEVCRRWETEALRAASGGIRTCCLRLGVVLAPEGGALAKLLPPFRLGLGGPLGSGRQWMSWIALDDVVGAVEHLLANTSLQGALNVTSPEPVTNAEFTRELGRALRRPAVLRVPAWVLRAALGEMADATLLASTRAVPGRLLGAGYVFRHQTLASALRAVLGRS